MSCNPEGHVYRIQLALNLTPDKYDTFDAAFTLKRFLGETANTLTSMGLDPKLCIQAVAELNWVPVDFDLDDHNTPMWDDHDVEPVPVLPVRVVPKHTSPSTELL